MTDGIPVNWKLRSHNWNYETIVTQLFGHIEDKDGTWIPDDKMLKSHSKIHLTFQMYTFAVKKSICITL